MSHRVDHRRGRKRFTGLTTAQHRRVAARLGAARQLSQQLAFTLQPVWGASSAGVRDAMRLGTGLDRIRSALDTCCDADTPASQDIRTPSPYYPATCLVPEALATYFQPSPTQPRSRPRQHLSEADGDVLVVHLAILRHLLDHVTFLILEGYGASHPVSARCQRLWRRGGLLTRLGLAIEREWLQRDRPFWPNAAGNAFLRRLDTLPKAVSVPAVWQAWFDVLDAPDVAIDGA